MIDYKSEAERVTQERVIGLFREELGYEYLGNLHRRNDNSNVKTELLRAFLRRSGYEKRHIERAMEIFLREVNMPVDRLYDRNHAVYQLLRYGVQVKAAVSEKTELVKLVDWDRPEQNHFALAEEVTVHGRSTKRPDLVLYLNGIAVGVLELKRSSVSIGDGIRQGITNQQADFIGSFFTTVQFVMAGNNTEGLRYGTIDTPEKYYLQWKEDEEDNSGYKLDKYLGKICRKERFIELMRDFVLFDGGVKKLPRVHQYFGIKAAQDYIKRRQGGIIWHTQGSGKSITMVLLAKWILESIPDARVVIVTDRDELDKQIERVFRDSGETIVRSRNGKQLLRQLAKPRPRLLCSLIHKFGRRDVDDYEQYIKELKAAPSQVAGELFVFVDECHRTQSDRLHEMMKATLSGAVFIGFTGTPLLKSAKKSSLEVFGSYIHTYKFNEAVEDSVVLDLLYEARDIDQRLGSEDKVDLWFEAKTRGLNSWQKSALQERWATMQKVLSSKNRMDKIVNDIIMDFEVKPQLSNGTANAILVTKSIYEACKYYDLFQKTPFRGKCAVVTSYNPQKKDITKEDTGANTETDKEFIYNTYQEILSEVQVKGGASKTEAYEDRAKRLFQEQPANMKLLIVVDKLLTGFDAPSCTYLYIDKKMQDHGLFQAICRVNRLNGEAKEFGYIVDYMDLFKSVDKALKVYTSELVHLDGDEFDSDIEMKDRLERGREKLDFALEVLAFLCEGVEPPKEPLQYLHFFCGNSEIATDLAQREPRRVQLYTGVVKLIRAYANISDELERAGYSRLEIEHIRAERVHYLELREDVRRHSGEHIDLKSFEADMRHLIDTYIQADESRKISPFDDVPLLELIVTSGIGEAINRMSPRTKGDRDAVAGEIENNIRKIILEEELTDPDFYDKMSEVLDELIALRRQKALDYEKYLHKIAELAKKVYRGKSDDTPESLDTPGKRALYNNLGNNEELALRLDARVKDVGGDDWRGHQRKENKVKGAIYEILQSEDETERLFRIIVEQKEY